MTLLGPSIQVPDWMDSASRYYSKIDGDSSDSVLVMKPPDEGDVSDKNPGTLCLRLAPAFREVRVLDASGEEEGLIRPSTPGLGYAMSRSGRSVWTLSTRSAVMKRHALTFSGDDTWDVRTPFFWWMNILCTRNGATHALGQVGPRKWLWFLWLAPCNDNHDVLSALAFLHRRWWRR